MATRNITVTDSAAGKSAIIVLPAISHFTVYPNPASDRITINSPVAGNITLSTIDGKTVFVQTIESGSNDVNLPVELPTGVLVLRFYGNDRSTQFFKLTIKTH